MRIPVLSDAYDWLVEYRGRILQFGLAYGAFELFNHAYDFLFFPFAIAWWGYALGGAIATAGAFGINAFVYFLYDIMKVDWLQAYTVSELADKENKTNLEKLLTWFRTPKETLRDKLLGIGLFIGLTLPLDPVIVAVYYRKSYFEGISLRDWGVLIASTASACFLWLVIWEPGVLIAKVLWHQILLFVAL